MRPSRVSRSTSAINARSGSATPAQDSGSSISAMPHPARPPAGSPKIGFAAPIRQFASQIEMLRVWARHSIGSTPLVSPRSCGPRSVGGARGAPAARAATPGGAHGDADRTRVALSLSLTAISDIAGAIATRLSRVRVDRRPARGSSSPPTRGARPRIARARRTTSEGCPAPPPALRPTKGYKNSEISLRCLRSWLR